MESREGMFEAPIAGMSLTSELGATPWQHPPQYNTVEETLDYYAPRILNADVKQDLISVMETGIPLTTIAQALQMGGVMEGKHTIDTAVLVNPIITEYIKGLADTAGIEYTMDAQESYIDMDVTESDLNRVEQDLLKEGMLTKDVVEDLKEDVTQDIPKMGLMSRKPVEEEIE